MKRFTCYIDAFAHCEKVIFARTSTAQKPAWGTQNTLSSCVKRMLLHKNACFTRLWQDSPPMPNPLSNTACLFKLFKKRPPNGFRVGLFKYKVQIDFALCRLYGCSEKSLLSGCPDILLQRVMRIKSYCWPATTIAPIVEIGEDEICFGGGHTPNSHWWSPSLLVGWLANNPILPMRVAVVTGDV